MISASARNVYEPMSGDRSPDQVPAQLSRRHMLKRSGNGFGAPLARRPARPRSSIRSNPGAFPRPCQAGHLPVHAWRPIHRGSVRPQAAAYPRHRKALPISAPRITSSTPGNLLPSPCPASSTAKAEPRSANSSQTSHRSRTNFASPIHALVQLSPWGCAPGTATASDTFTRPAMGSWINYGLGSENENLPGFITINPSGSHGGAGAWSSFCPPGIAGPASAGIRQQHENPLHRQPLQ